MQGDTLYAPWRMEYIRSLNEAAGDSCFLCDAAAATTIEQQRRCLSLWTSAHCVVLLNRYPYTNGHLLVAPIAHQADLEELTCQQELDFQQQTRQAVALLKRALSPQGFNIGMNLGRCAGAGLPGHLHQHIVPRWAGDVNFMTVVGEVRVVPQAVEQLWEELIRVRQQMLAAETS